jgi:hypothetical protein
VLTVFLESDCTLVGAQSTFSHLSRFDELDHSLSVSTLVSAQDTVFLPIFLHSCISTHTLLHDHSQQLKVIRYRKRTPQTFETAFKVEAFQHSLHDHI